MRTSDFSFDIPQELIAQEPEKKRGDSRLMIVERTNGELRNGTISDVVDFLPENSLLVLNDSRVNKARIYGETVETGGRVAFLFLEPLKPDLWKTMCRGIKFPGKEYLFPGGLKGRIEAVSETVKLLRFDRPVDHTYLEKFGSVPLPPYIRREPVLEDEDRYQTVFSNQPGSAAAPTAGLHFTRDQLSGIAEKGVQVIMITLHVGAGTFVPIRTAMIEDHTMHGETYEISDDASRKLNAALRDNREITAVGTTVVRTLEAAYRTGSGRIIPGKRSTDLYVVPGYRFNIVDHLITNFHTPRSSLLLLVSAFAGRRLTLEAYREAVVRRYRFFSYGDAMIIL